MDDRRGPRRKEGARMNSEPAKITRARTNRRKGDDGATLEDWERTVCGECDIMRVAELWDDAAGGYGSVVDIDVVEWLRNRLQSNAG